MSDSFFTLNEQAWFQPTEHTRGPWDQHACHAGPPTGILARAVEQLLPKQRLTRLTVNLQRPVPFAGFSVSASIVRQGRTVSLTEASLVDSQGKVIITAAGMHLTAEDQIDSQETIDTGNNHDDINNDENSLPTHSDSIGSPDSATEGPFPIAQTLHGLPAFNGHGVSVKYPPGENSSPGPTSAWMKTVPLLPNETASPFQRICPLADCGNAFGRNTEVHAVTFMNTDLTLLLHRDPVGEWLGTRSVGYWEPNGIGMADSLLFDEHGVVGRALQSLVLRRR